MWDPKKKLGSENLAKRSKITIEAKYCKTDISWKRRRRLINLKAFTLPNGCVHVIITHVGLLHTSLSIQYWGRAICTCLHIQTHTHYPVHAYTHTHVGPWRQYLQTSQPHVPLARKSSRQLLLRSRRREAGLLQTMLYYWILSLNTQSPGLVVVGVVALRPLTDAPPAREGTRADAQGHACASALRPRARSSNARAQRRDGTAGLVSQS